MKQAYRQRTPPVLNQSATEQAIAAVEKHRTLNPAYEERYRKARSIIQQNLPRHNNNLSDTIEWILDRYAPDHATRTLLTGTAGIINHEKQTT